MKSFGEILATISDDDMIKSYSGMTMDNMTQEQPELDNKILSEEEQKFNLAFWAKAARQHVGWDSFGQENTENFERTTEQLYNQINGPKNQKEFLENLAQKTAPYIQDRHFTLCTGSSHFGGGGKKDPGNVGGNLAYKQKPDGFKLIGEEKGKDKHSGNEYVLWQIGTINKNNEDILVVSIPTLCGKGDYEQWQGFIETFDKLYDENRDKWEKGRIVLDVRGNGGGEDKPIDHLAKRLYGNLVNTYKRCEITDSAISNKFLHDHGAYKPKNYSKDGLNEKDILQRRHFSNKNQPLFDETKTYYPFNPEKGYKGRLDILIDRNVGSSAESAYTSFYHHPNVRYVGENTAGMQQYTQGSFAMPCGYLMRVGVTKLTYWDKEGENIEVKGHKPDVDCKGRNAFEEILTIPRDQGRVMGFRELNEAVTGKEVFAEYDPKAKSDPRKAYYAKYLEPALKALELKNKNREYLNSVFLKAMNKKTAQNENNTGTRNLSQLRGLNNVNPKAPYKPQGNLTSTDFNSLQLASEKIHNR